MNSRWREKLLAMRATDERVRENLAATGELFDGYCPKMELVHLENAAELEKMIDENGGWLGKSLVGEDGAESAWLIALHSISKPNFMRRCASLIEKAVGENEAEIIQLAYLQDRISFFENRPQKYGTQSDWNEDGLMEVWTLENEELVNEFRAEVNLKPLKSLIWENVETSEIELANNEKRRAGFETWTKQVGWRD